MDKQEQLVRLKIVQELRSSAFLYTNVNPEHVLLCIKWGCTLLDAQCREACHKCNGDGNVHHVNCPERDKEVSKTAPDNVFDKLYQIMIGGCTCLTKTPEIRYHKNTCHYRLASEAADLLRKD